MSRVVLVTGVSRFLGGRLAARLAEDASVERIIGVDLVPPRPADVGRLGRTEFVRADLRNPLIAKVFHQAAVDTVVHAAVLSARRGVHARSSVQEQNLTGTMQLLNACQRSDAVEQVVVKSTTAVYGASARDPAVFTEDMPAGASASAFSRDAVEIENHVRGFARRRPDVAVTVLRFANLIGPSIDTALTRYLAMPLVPTSLGYDPRLQLLHESDAVEALRRATVERRAGVFNVAAAGVVSLAQAIRTVGRLRLPVPGPAISLAGELVRNAGVVEFSAEQTSFLTFGRAVDTSRLRAEFGWTPQWSTLEALRSYAAGRPLPPRLVSAVLGDAERALSARAAARSNRTPALDGA